MSSSKVSKIKETPFRITLDDLGLFQECEDSLVELSSRAIPLYASWFSNFLAPSARFLKNQKRVSNGLHFNVLEGRAMVKRSSLADERGFFCKNWWDFLWPSAAMKQDLKAELENQILVTKSWFGSLSHMDSHLHLHSIPWIYEVLREAATRHKIQHLRNPVEHFSDAKTFQMKTTLLELLNVFRKQPELPCFGISATFSLDAKKCFSLLEEGMSREFVFHTCLRVPSEIPEGARLVSFRDMEKRFQEHLQLSYFLDLLKREMA